MRTVLLQALILLAITIGFASTGSAGETKKVYDKNSNLKGYIQDDDRGTKKIYDKNWNTQNYIKDDHVYDKNWNRAGTIKDRIDE